ncbi:hypothetical protein EYC84_003420 [Monilinia fructicola]|uniref:Uncharacterized protein n=1 Tax=Monilinia fructicola TaxID=38448 RepID=A0A5M9JW47_MONFR|nr:hypothetical protein EYC84_003420 [Monilinia fructicola]
MNIRHTTNQFITPSNQPITTHHNPSQPITTHHNPSQPITTHHITSPENQNHTHRKDKEPNKSKIEPIYLIFNFSTYVKISRLVLFHV